MERRGAADLADLRIRIGHPVEHLEQMPVRTAEFVDRHGRIKASRAIRRLLSRAYGSAGLDGRERDHDPDGARHRGSPASAHVTGELDRRVFVARRLGDHRARSPSSSSSSCQVAPARGRDPAALRRPPLADGRLRHRPRQARRGTAALPARVDRRAHGRRAPRRCACSPPSSPSRASRRSRSSATGSPGRAPALAAAALAAGSWVLLFHGIYARMYSLFLFLSTLSYLALLRALKRRGWSAWVLWGLTMLLTIASHTSTARSSSPRRGSTSSPPASAGARRSPPSRPSASLAIPLWRRSLVLADRYDVGVGGTAAASSPRRTRSSRISGTSPATRRPATPACSSSTSCLRSSASHSSPARPTPRRAPRRLRRPDADALLPGRQVRRQLGARSPAT